MKVPMLHYEEDGAQGVQRLTFTADQGMLICAPRPDDPARPYDRLGALRNAKALVDAFLRYVEEAERAHRT